MPILKLLYKISILGGPAPLAPLVPGACIWVIGYTAFKYAFLRSYSCRFFRWWFGKTPRYEWYFFFILFLIHKLVNDSKKMNPFFKRHIYISVLCHVTHALWNIVVTHPIKLLQFIKLKQTEILSRCQTKKIANF